MKSSSVTVISAAVLLTAALLYMGLPAQAQDANSYGQIVPQQHYKPPYAQHSMAATNASQPID